jgi:hypothetical protein
MPETLIETVTLTKMECGECGIVFAIPSSKYRRCNDQGEDWYCPNGHCRIFCESENQKLQKQLTAERDRVIREKCAREQAETLANELEADKRKLHGKLSRIHKRIRNGVCPCCNRHFDNLERHMKSKHGAAKHKEPV